MAMTTEGRVKMTIGNLVVTNHALEAELERLRAELEAEVERLRAELAKLEAEAAKTPPPNPPPLAGEG